MTVRRRIRQGLDRLLGALVTALMISLAAVVLLGVAFRKAGHALVWYDEVASILLAWLTFYGAALAALRRAHIGFPKVMESLPPRVRVPLLVASELLVVAFFLVVAWAGWQVFVILRGEVLISLPWVPRRLAQSAVPLAAILYLAAELTVLPDVIALARRGARVTTLTPLGYLPDADDVGDRDAGNGRGEGPP